MNWVGGAAGGPRGIGFGGGRFFVASGPPDALAGFDGRFGRTGFSIGSKSLDESLEEDDADEEELDPNKSLNNARPCCSRR